MPSSVPMSTMLPMRLMPSLNMMSNSATRNGGATLFLTTFTRTRFPTTSVPCLMDSMRRISMRTDA
jgi:hypothetical protein